MRYHLRLSLLCLFFIFTQSVRADKLTVDPPQVWDSDCPSCVVPPPPPACSSLPLPLQDQIKVELRNPIYEDGVIKTEEGGVLTGIGLRIQAQKICYNRQEECASVECEGDLLVDFNDKVLVGEKLFYDFKTNTGKLICGKTAVFPWFLGGEEIELCADATLRIRNAYISTSEGEEKEVRVTTPFLTVSRDRIVTAENITFWITKLPIFWIPYATVDLNRTLESPVAFNAGWDGFLGSHIGIRYHFLTMGALKGYARVDGYFGRGIGLGLETEYAPSYSPTECYTRNYYAHDLSIDDPQKKDRYRFEGTYYTRLFENTTSINLIYDVVSDPEMAADYETRDFELNTAGRTQLEIRRQEEFWIANVFARARVNSFQSVNQELPSFEMDFLPFELGSTNITFDQAWKVGYLDYVFSEDVAHAQNFHAGRFEVHPCFYRPSFFGPLTITPSACFVGIAYTNSPSGNPVGQAVGDLGLSVEATLKGQLARCYHNITPYLDYHYITSPRASLDNHYLFSIGDAYDRLNILRLGTRHFFFQNCLASPIWMDIWTNCFFDSHTIHPNIPKAYFELECHPFAPLLFTFDTAWNFRHRQLDFFNTRLEWALTRNWAIALEYRHRSRFDWRKADFYNFLLDAVRSEQELLASPLSDRRDIAIGRTFYRFTPNFGAGFEIRHGWNRKAQPSFTEYQIELDQVVFQHWHFLFSYEKRTEDHRFSVTLKLDKGPNF